MAFNLRPYQQKAVNKIMAAWQRVRSVLFVCPTGGGKTVIFSSIIRDHNGASCAVVHRKEIVSQISLSLAKLGVKHRIIAPDQTVRRIRRRHLKLTGKSFVDPQAQTSVASVQTLTSTRVEKDPLIQAFIRQVTLAVYDEGHHYVDSGKWAKAVRMFEIAKLLFVSASPERADGKGLGAHASGFVEEMVEGPTTKWLIENGYLSKYKYYAPNSDLDVSDLAVTASGDFNAKALRERVVDSHLIGDIVQHYKSFGGGASFIVFNTDVKTAEETAVEFNKHGLTCQALSGETDAGVRDAELDKFENGENLGLCNVDLFDEGFDVPALVVCILGRPTQSLAKYLQMVGRALRIMKGKSHAVIIDPVRNWERHGMPDWPRQWTLDDRKGGDRKSTSDEIPQKSCKLCTQPYEAFYPSCPHCGYAAPPVERKAPEQVDGDLQELDVEAMAALFEKMQRADMSDEEFELDMFNRNVPAIGRGKELRRHQAAKYRREVLRNLVGWWVGMQDSRPINEVHRRFYHRFGVDIGTAFTLNAKDTDALAERIKKSFTKDLTA